MRHKHIVTASAAASAVLLTVLAACASLSQHEAAEAGADLLAYADPAEAGFSTAQLESARAFADGNRAGAVVALYRGRVVAAWGAVERPLPVQSLRKSLAGALYGLAIEEGRLSLEATLESMDFDDEPRLTANERQARLRHLLESRSGVYHGAAYSDDQTLVRPARGSRAPGEFFFYNNWDFNSAEAIYERQTGEDIYRAFYRRIARAIGMQDFDPANQLRVLEPTNSRHPAHTFRMSARDLARFGQLYLQGGLWGGRQVVPAQWVRESLMRRSEAGHGAGYGYLWWIYDPGSLGADYPRLNQATIHLARGTGGQAIFIIPSEELVVVHLADQDNGRGVRGPQVWQLVERLAAARTSAAQDDPSLGPVRVSPLASNLAPRVLPPFVSLSNAERAALVGSYAAAQGGVVRVFEYDGRLFANFPEYGEAELFATGPRTFLVLAQAGVAIEFDATPGGQASRLRATVGDRTLDAERL